MEENNQIIANFMGLKPVKYTDKLNHPRFGICSKNNLLYSSSWDWLMPVVDKIEETNFIRITREGCVIFSADNTGNIAFAAFESEGKIKSVYKCVVEFIKNINP